MNELVVTSDGSHTIYIPEMNEHYHSIHGAVQESQHIFIKAGFDFCEANPAAIFEVGFGTGLNALLTAMKSISSDIKVNYTTIEKYPVSSELIDQLNFHNYTGIEGKMIFSLIHSSPWNTLININKNFNLKKIRSDFITESVSGKYDLIYFDAFGPDKQPSMWTPEIFSKISAMTNRNGIFVTYSAKGEVKRNLRANGFEVSLLPGPPGKRQIIRAVKI